jgi:surfactin synthase thioesterase subunit
VTGGPRCFSRFTERSDAVVNLICIPWAGSGAMPFFSWADRMPPEVELYGVRLAGRESRLMEPPVRSMPDVVDGLLAETTWLPPRPYVLYGQCMGALIAFEWIRVVRARGMALPLRLIAADSRGPSAFTRPQPPFDMVTEVSRYAETITNPRMFDLMRPAIEADLTVVRDYICTATEPFSTPFTVIQSSHSTDASRAFAEWSTESVAATTRHEIADANLFPDGAWQELATAVQTDIELDLRCWNGIGVQNGP